MASAFPKMRLMLVSIRRRPFPVYEPQIFVFENKALLESCTFHSPKCYQTHLSQKENYLCKELRIVGVLFCILASQEHSQKYEQILAYRNINIIDFVAYSCRQIPWEVGSLKPYRMSKMLVLQKQLQNIQLERSTLSDKQHNDRLSALFFWPNKLCCLFSPPPSGSFQICFKFNNLKIKKNLLFFFLRLNDFQDFRTGKAI